MLKNLFRIPDTFDPDDRRRRQVLNVVLIFSLMLIISIGMLLVFICGGVTCGRQNDLLTALPVIVALSILFFMNRSPRIPSDVTGAIFIALFVALCSQMDTPQERYNGRSTIVFALPIMLTAMILRPDYTFLTTLVICGMFQFLTPPDPRYPENSVNYFSMADLIFIAFISWLGMSIANRAIRDARRQAAHLQTVLNSITDGVLVLDPEGNFLSANPALQRMIPEDQLKQINLKSLDDTLRWERKIFSVRRSPVPEVGSVIVFRDETRRRETEHAKDALLATVSHELRTPLAVMMNYIELMQALVGAGRVNSDEFNQHLTRAVENCKRLHHLVNNIMDQAQIQAGALQLKQQRFNLPAMLEKTRQFVQESLEKKHLAFKMNIHPEVPAEINGDPDRLRQALTNLLGNAAKFTNQGWVQVNVSLPDRETLSIEVVDTGPGIPTEQLPDIFETFRRGSDYIRREQQGAGLGLSIAKEIITHMGGQISVISTPGTGSTFTVSLPIR